MDMLQNGMYLINIRKGYAKVGSTGSHLSLK